MAIKKTHPQTTRSENNGKSALPKYEDINFVDSTKPVWNYSLFTDEDIENFQQRNSL